MTNAEALAALCGDLGIDSQPLVAADLGWCAVHPDDRLAVAWAEEAEQETAAEWLRSTLEYDAMPQGYDFWVEVEERLSGMFGVPELEVSDLGTPLSRRALRPMRVSQM
jgi:hypothetical protein